MHPQGGDPKKGHLEAEVKEFMLLCDSGGVSLDSPLSTP